jgi:uncharacterized oxidoreductase
MKISGNVILLTGGGSGIGRALAQRWHDFGNQVIITGRRIDALRETADGRAGIHPYVLDVGDAPAISEFAAMIVSAHPDLNVLVNNAGIMRNEDISGARDLNDAEEMIVTNVLGPIRLIDALIDHLKSASDAVIINVSSGLAFVPLARAATYSATKAALHSYTLALRQKLAGAVEVIEIVPPAVQTELTPGQSQREDYLPLAQFIDETMAQFETGNPAPEVCVPMVLFLRNAEAEGRFEQTMEAIANI